MLKDIHQEVTKVQRGARGLREGLENLAKANGVEVSELHEAATQYVAGALQKAMQGDPNMLTGEAAATLAALDAYANHEGVKRSVDRKASEREIGSPVMALLGKDQGKSREAMTMLAQIGNDPKIEKYLAKWNKILAAAGNEEARQQVTARFKLLQKQLDDAYTAAGQEQERQRSVAGQIMASHPNPYQRA